MSLYCYCIGRVISYRSKYNDMTYGRWYLREKKKKKPSTQASYSYLTKKEKV